MQVGATLCPLCFPFCPPPPFALTLRQQNHLSSTQHRMASKLQQERTSRVAMEHPIPPARSGCDSHTRWREGAQLQIVVIALSTHSWLGDDETTNVLALRRHSLPSIVRNLGTISNWPDRAGLLIRRVQSKTCRGDCSVQKKLKCDLLVFVLPHFSWQISLCG